MYRVILLILLLMIAGVLFQTNPLILAAEQETETSVVTLLIKSDETVIEKDPLFEILDLESYILVPISKLSSRLELRYDYRREEDLLILECKKTGHQAKIDFKKRVYLVDETPKWSECPPFVQNSDFFVSPALLEYLSEVKIEWSSKYQELTVLGDWNVPTAGTNNPNLPPQEQPENLAYQEGPPCSFGTVRYELSWQYQKDDAGLVTSEGKLALRGDGRAGKWAISLGGELEYKTESGDQSGELSLIRAKYNDHNKMVVFGDSELYLPNTLHQQNLRGVLLMSSENAFARFLIPYTSLSGPAEAGDQVYLYINGKAFDEQTIAVGQNSYRFNDVPLNVKRLNIIKIVIEKPSGECRVTQKNLSSSLRVLDPTTHEWLVAGGNYRHDENEAWSKKLAGFKVKRSLSDNFFLETEAFRTEDRDENQVERVLYGAETGLAFRLGQNTICTLDWLVGGPESDPEQGWKASALYCLEKGFIEGVLFFINPEITHEKRVQEDPGRGFKILGELEITDRTSYQLAAEQTNPLPGMTDSFTAHKFDLRRNRKFGPQLDNLFTLGLSQQRLQQQTTSAATARTDDISRFFADQSVYGKNTNFRNSFTFDHVQTVTTESTTSDETGATIKNTNEIIYEADYIKMISELYMFNLSAEARRGYGDEQWAKLMLDSNLKWLSRDKAAGVYFSVNGEGSETVYAESPFHSVPFGLNSGGIGLWGKYYFTPERSIYGAWEWNLYQHDASYQSATLNLTQLRKDNNGKIYAEYKYNSPFSSTSGHPSTASSARKIAQHTYRLGVERTLKNGLEIKLEAERLYSDINATAPEQVYRLTCGQAIGFSGRRYKTIKADDENLSLVSGIIYLDENGNAQYDRGEKVLPNLRMSLNGRRVTTNEKGEYLYRNVEPDAYQLFFDLKSLPADYTPVNDARLFKLKANENMFFDFGVTLNGSIAGKVFIDQNSNRIYDEGDKPLSWAAVLLDNGKKKVFTGNDGTFYFENVALGEHTVEILADSIPKDMVIVGKKTFDFRIRETALDVTEMNVPVVFQFNP